MDKSVISLTHRKELEELTRDVFYRSMSGQMTLEEANEEIDRLSVLYGPGGERAVYVNAKAGEVDES